MQLKICETYSFKDFIKICSNFLNALKMLVSRYQKCTLEIIYYSYPKRIATPCINIIMAQGTINYEQKFILKHLDLLFHKKAAAEKY